MRALTVVIAPDSFKGSATATEVADAIAQGWAEARPDDRIRRLPMADGGEGTLEAFETAVPGSKRMPVRVVGPDGTMVDAFWLLLPDGRGVVELANTSGITLLDPLQPFGAHTLGFGQAIAAALDHGVCGLLLALGGSSSTDAGAGALVALGARLLDSAGEPVSLGNAGLASVASVELSGLRPLPAGGVTMLSDVTNPLLGGSGAAAVFGPQKGATPEQVIELEANLHGFARLIDVDEAAPGAGSAGGTGFGLLAWGAERALGADAVGDALGAPGVVGTADVVVTGEGRFDAQSAAGKVPSYIASLAAPGSRAMLVAGSIDAETTELFHAAASLVSVSGSVEAAIDDAPRWLRVAGELLARSLD
ncbi:glycerate kinase [Okibacterium endophyticum]